MSELSFSGLLNQIHHGDCIVGMNTMPAGSVDLAFADPPFNIGYDYDVYDDARARHDYLDWSRAWIGTVHRALKPDGTFWLAIGDEYAAELKLISQEVGFHCRSWVIWYYTFGVNCKAKFSRSHAHLFHFVKDPTQFTFRSDLLENRIPSARQLVYADKRANSVGRLPDDTWILKPQDDAWVIPPDDEKWTLRPQDSATCLTPGEDTWYFPRVAGTFKERAGFHGCQMPEQLLGRIIRFCSNEGETVLDPFSGSATTLVVAKKLGRRFIGFDLSSEYIQRGRDRLDNCRVGDPLDGSAEPVVSAPATPPTGVRKGKKVATPKGEDKTIAGSTSNAERLFEKGLIEAFAQSSQGFSADRVVADRNLNEEFVETCRRLGLPGEARTWNWNLLNFRKAKKLVGVPTIHETRMSWSDCDHFLHASEIALAKMLDEGCTSLDAILCDPEQAAQFDEIASSFCHDDVRSLDYRWGALKLRKEARKTKNLADLLGGITPARLSSAQSVSQWKKRWHDVPEQAGVYLILGANHRESLYAGEALNLRQRLQNQFSGSPLRAWKQESNELQIRFFTAEARARELLAYQFLLAHKHKTKLNVREVAA